MRAPKKTPRRFTTSATAPKERPAYIKAMGCDVLVPARGSIDTFDTSAPSTSSTIAFGPCRLDAGVTLEYKAPGDDHPFYAVAGLFEARVFPLEREPANPDVIFFEEKKRWKAQRLGLAQGISHCLINKQQGSLGLGLVVVAESFTRLVAISETTVLVEVHPNIANQFEGLECNITTLLPENIGDRLLANSFLLEDWGRRGTIKDKDINLDAVIKFREFWLRCFELSPKLMGPSGLRSFAAVPEDLLSDPDWLPVECARSEDLYRLYEILRHPQVGQPPEAQPRPVPAPLAPDELDPDDSCSLAGERAQNEPAERAFEELAASTRFKVRACTSAMMDEVLSLLGSCAFKCGRKLCCHQSQEALCTELVQENVS